MAKTKKQMKKVHRKQIERKKGVKKIKREYGVRRISAGEILVRKPQALPEPDRRRLANEWFAKEVLTLTGETLREHYKKQGMTVEDVINAGGSYEHANSSK